MDQFKNNRAGAFRAARKMVPGKDHHFMGKTMRQMRDPVDARRGHNIAGLESLWLVYHFELKVPGSGGGGMRSHECLMQEHQSGVVERHVKIRHP
jgi:hypothetical protein